MQTARLWHSLLADAAPYAGAQQLAGSYYLLQHCTVTHVCHDGTFCRCSAVHESCISSVCALQQSYIAQVHAITPNPSHTLDQSTLAQSTALAATHYTTVNGGWVLVEPLAGGVLNICKHQSARPIVTDHQYRTHGTPSGCGVTSCT
jgi:hypothetical protein